MQTFERTRLNIFLICKIKFTNLLLAVHVSYVLLYVVTTIVNVFLIVVWYYRDRLDRQIDKETHKHGNKSIEKIMDVKKIKMLHTMVNKISVIYMKILNLSKT